MIDLRMIDVAIGIIFIYLLICMVCSIIREAIENLLNRRAANLEEAIRELFGIAGGDQKSDKSGGPGIDKLYDHSLISVLYSGKYNEPPGSRRGRSGRPFLNLEKIAPLRHLPGYIPPSTFALALIDLVGRSSGKDQPGHSAPLTIDSLRQNVDKIENPTLKGALLVALDNADGKLEQVRESIETWFNTAMDAVTARYRRNTNFIIFGIALIVSVGINVDTFRVVDYLYRNTSVRDALVAQATEAAKRDDLHDFNAAKSALEATELPIGWSCGKGPKLLPCRVVPPPGDDTSDQVEPGEGSQTPSMGQGEPLVRRQYLQAKSEDRWNGDNILELLSFIAGWLVTAFAATLGAPFWFDLLKKSIQARNIVQSARRVDTQATPDKPGGVPPGK
jgi:hypothetical protein